MKGWFDCIPKNKNLSSLSNVAENVCNITVMVFSVKSFQSCIRQNVLTETL